IHLGRIVCNVHSGLFTSECCECQACGSFTPVSTLLAKARNARTSPCKRRTSTSLSTSSSEVDDLCASSSSTSSRACFAGGYSVSTCARCLCAPACCCRRDNLSDRFKVCSFFHCLQQHLGGGYVSVIEVALRGRGFLEGSAEVQLYLCLQGFLGGSLLRSGLFSALLPAALHFLRRGQQFFERQVAYRQARLEQFFLVDVQPLVF